MDLDDPITVFGHKLIGGDDAQQILARQLLAACEKLAPAGFTDVQKVQVITSMALQAVLNSGFGIGLKNGDAVSSEEMAARMGEVANGVGSAFAAFGMHQLGDPIGVGLLFAVVGGSVQQSLVAIADEEAAEPRH